LNLVGILFPHINDDAPSKSHQTCKFVDFNGLIRHVTMYYYLR